jgi:hypothetical protein
MATYKEIKGITIQTKDTDPNLAGVAGATWSSGGSLNTARKGSAGAGAQTTTLIYGGTLNPPTTLGETELYNGSSWTEVADLNTDRAYHGGSGTSTAALSTGGSTTGDSPITPSALNEKYDGSSWTEVGDINTARVFCPLFGGSGTTTAAILCDGYVPTSPNNYNADAVESWNGSSWSEVAEFNTPRRASGSFGTATAGIVAGGYVASPNGNVEEWDGSSFTEVADLNTPRIVYSNGFGVSTLGVIAGGAAGSTYYGNTEFWNGSSWSEVNDMATGRSESGNSDSSSASSGLVAGGREASPGAGISTTEEFTQSSSPVLVEGMLFLSENTTLKGFGKAAGIPVASFSSGGSLNTSRGYMAGCGTQTAGSVFGGSPYNPPTNKSQLHEQYDGSSWTETTDTNSGHSAGSASTKGTQTAVIVFTGGPPPSGVKNEQWDGSSWTETNDLSTSRNNGPAGFGVSTSAICCGGNNPPITTTESWDGTSWTAVNNMNGGRRNFAGCGPSTAGIVAGGQGPGGVINSSETWDGTSWTETNNLNAARRGVMLFGDGSTTALCAGGGGVANNEYWNGTSWTELNDLSTARNDGGAAGTTVAGFVAGGPQSGGSATEEWTADATLSTVTLS